MNDNNDVINSIKTRYKQAFKNLEQQVGNFLDPFEADVFLTLLNKEKEKNGEFYNHFHKNEQLSTKATQELKVELEKNPVAKVLMVMQAVLSKEQLSAAELEEQIDLYTVLNALLGMVQKVISKKTATEQKQLIEEELKTFFRLREADLLNTNADYCYSHSSLGNQLCVDVVNAIFMPVCNDIEKEKYDNSEDEDGQKSPFNFLLADAISKDKNSRTKPWTDVYLNDQLPIATAFFRIDNNDIHLYAEVVDAALKALKSGKTKLAEIWTGTDLKNRNSLPIEALQILKQRTPTLKKLVEFTEGVAAYYAKGITVIERLRAFREGLRQGDKEHNGSETRAGDSAVQAQQDFSNWWKNTLKEVQREQIIKLKYKREEVFEGENGEIERGEVQGTFESILSNLTDTNYCIQDIGANIDVFIEQNLNKLQELTIDLPENVKIDKLSLDKLYQQPILEELKDQKELNVLSINKPLVITPHLSQLSDNNIPLPTNLNLTKYYIDQNIKQVSEQCKKADTEKYADKDIIIAAILKMTSNEQLIQFREELQNPQYNYLRARSGVFSEFSRFYAVNASGEREKTSRTWAEIEQAFAMQMVKNAVDVAKKEDVNNNQNVEMASQQKSVKTAELLKAHSFISNCRKGKFQGKSKSHTAKLLEAVTENNGSNEEKVLEQLNKKIAAITPQNRM